MDDSEIRERIADQISQIRALARAIYYARTSAEFDDMMERLDYVEDELQQVADRIWDFVAEMPSPADWQREKEPAED